MEMSSEAALLITRESCLRRSAIGWVFAIAILAWVCWSAFARAQFNPTDYVAWQADWQRVVACAGDGIAGPCEGVSKFPPAYLLNAGMVEGKDGSDRLHLFWLNLGALLLPLGALATMRGAAVLFKAGWAYVAALAISPLPMFYLASGALEVQSAVFSGLYLGAVAQVITSPGLKPNAVTWCILVVSGLLFPLYKDTGALFVGLAVLLLLVTQRSVLRALWSTEGGVGRLRRFVLAASMPVLVAQILAASYSWFKYGRPLPVAYMAEAEATQPSLSTSAEFLFGSLFSPNGGLLIFWALPVFIALAGWRWVGLAPRREVLLLAGTVLLVSCLAFARWWAPFGWDGWGNRLLVPAMLSAMVAALTNVVMPAPPSQPSANRLTVLACVPLLICSLYYIVIPYVAEVGVPMSASLWPGEACARMRDALGSEALTQGAAFWKSDIYYECARERMLHVPAP